MDQPIHDADDGIFDRTMYDYASRNTIWVIVHIRVAQSSEYSDSRFHNGILIVCVDILNWSYQLHLQ